MVSADTQKSEEETMSTKLKQTKKSHPKQKSRKKYKQTQRCSHLHSRGVRLVANLLRKVPAPALVHRPVLLAASRSEALVRAEMVRRILLELALLRTLQLLAATATNPRRRRVRTTTKPTRRLLSATLAADEEPGFRRFDLAVGSISRLCFLGLPPPDDADFPPAAAAVAVAASLLMAWPTCSSMYLKTQGSPLNRRRRRQNASA